MIIYNGKRWTSYCRKEGTVILKAFPYAFLVATVAFVLKHLDDLGVIEMTKMEIIKDSAAYSGFTFVLGFVLVFRSSQCYARFWTCAGSCCTMRAQLGEAASSLLTFCIMTTKNKDEVQEFSHKIVRLFSLLHALCLQHVADKADENFLIIDARALGKRHMSILAKLDQKGRVDMVYQWIGALIMQSAKSGLLNTPPPILSRVFQELEKGMVEYNQVLQVMSIPFPFPYAQVSVMLLVVYMICTPVVMCYYVGNPYVAACLSFITVLCLVSIELISSELENPLGDDANDLPCHEWQSALNETLLGMLHPHANDVWELDSDAIRDDKIFSAASLQPVNAVVIDSDDTQFSSKDELTEGSWASSRCHPLRLHSPPSANSPMPHAPAFPVQASPVIALQSSATETQTSLGAEIAQASVTLQMQQSSVTLQMQQSQIQQLSINQEHLRRPVQPSGIMHQTSGAVAQCDPDATPDVHFVASTIPRAAHQAPITEQCIRPPLERDAVPLELEVTPPEQNGTRAIGSRDLDKKLPASQRLQPLSDACAGHECHVKDL
jgi:putative membrane protein